MATRRTWLWIVGGVLACCVVALVALAGAGVYFVSRHIDTTRTTSAGAFRAFDEARAVFKDQKPLFEVDAFERPRLTRALGSLPTAPERPKNLWVLAWDPDDERLVRISLPFWLLKMGHRNIEVSAGHGSFDLQRLDVDARELERIGPTLLFDYRAPSGERVLVWTH